jgi:hypothetical protein
MSGVMRLADVSSAVRAHGTTARILGLNDGDRADLNDLDESTVSGGGIDV